MNYKGYTIETKKYKIGDIYYGVVRETGMNTIDCSKRKDAIKEAKRLVDYLDRKQEPDSHLEERYENQYFEEY